MFNLKSADRVNILATLGRCCSESEKYNYARVYFAQAIDMGLTQEWEGEVHMRQGIALAKLGLLNEAKSEFQWCEERVDKLGLDANKIYQWLSWVCRGLGEKSKGDEYERLSRPS